MLLYQVVIILNMGRWSFTNAVVSGGNYAHTFVSATTNAVRKQNSAITSRTSSSACSDVQSAIDTLGTIVTDAIAAGNITGGIWNQPANAGTFITGELSVAEI